MKKGGYIALLIDKDAAPFPGTSTLRSVHGIVLFLECIGKMIAIVRDEQIRLVHCSLHELREPTLLVHEYILLL